MAAAYQEWRDKTGAGPKQTPSISGADLLGGIHKALGWQGFFIFGANRSEYYYAQEIYDDANDGIWHRVSLVPSLAITDCYAGDTARRMKLRELPFAVIAEIGRNGISGHMGMLVYGKWYELHSPTSRSSQRQRGAPANA